MFFPLGARPLGTSARLCSFMLGCLRSSAFFLVFSIYSSSVYSTHGGASPAVSKATVPVSSSAPAPSNIPSSSRSFWSTRSIPAIATSSPYVYLWDISTNTVLLDKKSSERMAPSSMTKILTVYLGLKALHDGVLKLSDRLHVSSHAAKQPGSRMFIRPQENIRVDDIFKGIIVASGNDACTVLAEHLAGDEGAFAQHMNSMAQQIGMTNSHFVNASGLPDPSQYSTCRDLAVVADRTIKEFPDFYSSYYSIPRFVYNSVNQVNRLPLLKNKFSDGLKTGCTDAGKYGLVASSLRGKRRLILVINGCASNEVRANESRRLLQWGFQNFTAIHIPKHQKILTIPLWPHGEVDLITEHSYSQSLPTVLTQKAVMTATYTQPLPLPVGQHQRLGTLTINLPDRPSISIPLIAKNSVAAPSLLSQTWDFIRSLFISPPTTQTVKTP